MKTKILKQLISHRLIPILLLMPLLLSGCSIMGVYEGSFDCPAGKGVGCKSISDVNDMVNQNTLSKDVQNDTQDDPEHPESNSSHDALQEPCGRCSVRTPSSWQDEIWWSDALEGETIPLWIEDEVGA